MRVTASYVISSQKISDKTGIFSEGMTSLNSKTRLFPAVIGL